MIGYVKHFDSNKTIVIINYLKNYNKIWSKISDLINIEFDGNLFMVMEINI